jgi:hypothetical protein
MAGCWSPRGEVDFADMLNYMDEIMAGETPRCASIVPR